MFVFPSLTYELSNPMLGMNGGTEEWDFWKIAVTTIYHSFNHSAQPDCFDIS